MAHHQIQILGLGSALFTRLPVRGGLHPTPCPAPCLSRIPHSPVPFPMSSLWPPAFVPSRACTTCLYASRLPPRIKPRYCYCGRHTVLRATIQSIDHIIIAMSSSTSHPDVISPSGLSISQLPSLMARPAPKQGPPSSSTSSTPTATAAAAAGQPPSGKPPGFTPRHKSTRAERACFSCHKRKIRCDVVRKSPCSNCHVDKLEV